MNLSRFDIVTLGLFVAVARHGSISAAAREMHIAVGAASKRISDLEDTLKISLFNRFAFGVELTAAGKICFEHASRVLTEVERLHDAIANHRLRALGTVRVAAVPSALLGALLNDLDAFMQAHPDARVELEEMTSQEVVETIKARRADIGFCVEPAPTAGLTVWPYETERLVVMVRNDHPLAGRQSLHLEDTLEFVHTGLMVDTALASLLQRQLMLLNKSAPFWFRARSFDTMCFLAQTTNTVAILADVVADRYRDPVSTRLIPLDEPWATLHSSMLVHDVGALSPPARSLLATLRRDRRSRR